MSKKQGNVRHITAEMPWTIDARELWQYRHLAMLLAWRSIRIRYKQTILGFLWSVLTPLAYTLIFVFFFKILPVQPTGDVPYVPAVFSGMILWQLFARGVAEAGASLTGNANLITKVYFPRMLLPISSVLSSLIDFAISFALLVGVLVWYQMPLTANALFAPLFVLHMLVLILGFGLWISAIDGLFRDLRHALPLLLQLGMFVSPVAYMMTSLIPEKWQALYAFNPVVAPLEGFRWSFVAGAPAPEPTMLIKSAAITIALLLTGAVFFTRVERTVVDRV